MVEHLHRIKVFVFQQASAEPSYLLLRSQAPESCWGPIQGNLGFGEKLETAIRREVMDDLGLVKSLDVIDLAMPVHWNLGVEDVIEWTYGVKTTVVPSPLHLDAKFAEHRWANFSQAYPTLELDLDRAAILRLHTLLSAA